MQQPLTAADDAVGTAVGAAACITHHSDERTVTAALSHTPMRQHTHANTSAALTATTGDGADGEATA